MMLMNDVDYVEMNGSPPQLLELNVNDRLHLGTTDFKGTAYKIHFCVLLVRVS